MFKSVSNAPCGREKWQNLGIEAQRVWRPEAKAGPEATSWTSNSSSFCLWRIQEAKAETPDHASRLRVISQKKKESKKERKIKPVTILSSHYIIIIHL